MNRIMTNNKKKLSPEIARSLVSDAKLASAIYTASPEQLAKMLPNSTVLFSTQDYKAAESTKINGYTASVLLSGNEIIVVTAGTKTSGSYVELFRDIVDDVALAFNAKPPKLKAACALNDAIIKHFGDAMEGYKVRYIGHSLGAALSEMAALDMAQKLDAVKMLHVNQISSVTFDNPGVAGIVDAQKYSSLVKFVECNGADNIVNTMGKQVGELHRTVDCERSNIFRTLDSICSVSDRFCGSKGVQLLSPLMALLQIAQVASYGLEQASAHNIDTIIKDLSLLGACEESDCA